MNDDADASNDPDSSPTAPVAPAAPDNRPIIDRVGSDLREATSLLSLAGLGDAFVMLRRPEELSDGQRFRFRLAQAMEAATRLATDPPLAGSLADAAPAAPAVRDSAQARGVAEDVPRAAHPLRSTSASTTFPSQLDLYKTRCVDEADRDAAQSHRPLLPSTTLPLQPDLYKTRSVDEDRGRCAALPAGAVRCVIIADEFAATLDRLTAKTIARNVRRWIDRSARDGGAMITFIAATTHDDLLEPMHPEVLVHKGLGEHVEVMTRWPAN